MSVAAAEQTTKQKPMDAAQSFCIYLRLKVFRTFHTTERRRHAHDTSKLEQKSSESEQKFLYFRLSPAASVKQKSKRLE